MKKLNIQPVFVSTSSLAYEQPVGSRISLYQEHGLNAIELGGGVSYSSDSLSQITQSGAQFLVHNYFPPPRETFVLNLASINDAISHQSLDLVTRAIELAAQISAAFYSVHAGFITDPVGFNGTCFIFPSPEPSNTAEQAMERFSHKLETVLAHAEQAGIGILVENNMCSHQCRGKLLLQSAEEFLSLFSDLRSSNLGLLLDTGHLNVSAHTLGFDRMSFVDKVAPFIRAIHIHDNDGVSDTHQPIEPASWVLDVLRRSEFTTVPIIVESRFNNIDELRRYVDWLKDEIERE